MTDDEMLDWVDSLEDFRIDKVEDDEGRVFWEATADSIHVGHGFKIRVAIEHARRNMEAGKAIPNLTLERTAERIARAATGQRQRPEPN